ncbi:MAG: YbaB/EbfC family nucleoid-associated protein [Rickettsiales bacterium]|jgi:DNA-binding YbaB/EbfC family protein|nr:YbaB/EbfC family nucleoid-associated protein [Rickettsiales bacterium]
MNIQQIMRQAQNMQKKVQEEQAKLDLVEFEGTSGGGSVKIKMSGKRIATSVFIDESLMTPDDKETLEDLLLVAINDVSGKVNKANEDLMQSATNGIKLPF